ncbi:MAG: DMT family transporter [Anaerolineae bacterium]|nr:DMT family transporter [Anaerolineae bacterium]
MMHSDTSDATFRKGAAFSTLSAMSYATAVVFVRYAYQSGLTPGMAIFLRFAIAAVILRGFLSLSGQWVRLPRAKVIALFLLGFLAYTILGTTWFLALSMMPAWLVSLFVAIYPLLVSLCSWLFLGEAFTTSKVLSLCLVIGGSFALFWQPFERAVLVGILLMVINMIVQTLYVLIGQHWTREVPPAMSAVWMIIGAAVGTLIYAGVSQQFSLDFAPVGWLWATGFAVFATALAILFLWAGIGLLGPTRAAIIGSLEPLFSILLSVSILGETMSLLQIFGGMLLLAGVLLVRVQWVSVGKVKK